MASIVISIIACQGGRWADLCATADTLWHSKLERFTQYRRLGLDGYK